MSALKQKMVISYPWGMDADDSFLKFKAEALPSTVTIDRKGNVRYVDTGMIDQKEVEKAIRSVL